MQAALGSCQSLAGQPLAARACRSAGSRARGPLAAPVRATVQAEAGRDIREDAHNRGEAWMDPGTWRAGRWGPRCCASGRRLPRRRRRRRSARPPTRPSPRRPCCSRAAGQRGPQRQVRALPGRGQRRQQRRGVQPGRGAVPRARRRPAGRAGGPRGCRAAASWAVLNGSWGMDAAAAAHGEAGWEAACLASSLGRACRPRGRPSARLAGQAGSAASSTAKAVPHPCCVHPVCPAPAARHGGAGPL